MSVSGTISHGTGVAPVAAIAWKQAAKVSEGVMTSSPGPTPSASSAMWSAAVPVLTAITCRAPR